MLAQVTDSGSNNITMAKEMHAQFPMHEQTRLDLDMDSEDDVYTWNPKTDYT
jgi:hypothetical protein